MLQRILVLATFGIALASCASADVITYMITVNTASQTGDTGSLDFQFNPGALVTQSADLSILNFTSDGSLSGPTPTGDVSGTLPGTVLFDNGSAFNDYFTAFTYGTTLTFDVLLSGPALSSPDGVSTSGSTFAFSMFSDAAGTLPVLTTDTTNGFAVTIDVNLDGSTSLTNSSTETTSSIVPEPATLLLVPFALAVLFGVRRAWRKDALS